MEIDYKKFEVETLGALYDCGNRMRRRNMLSLLPDLSSKAVLEVGVGMGDFWLTLSNAERCNYSFYIGIDISVPNLRNARHLIANSSIQKENIVLLGADVFNLPFADGSVDVLICAEVLEHLDDKKTMKEMSRVLKRSGCALITVPYLGEPVAGWGHLRHYDLNTMQALASEAGLKLGVQRIFGRLHEITWVKFKRILYSAWGVWKKYSGSEKNYYESEFHRHFIMPIVDRFLKLDDIFSSTRSILGDKGYIAVLLTK